MTTAASAREHGRLDRRRVLPAAAVCHRAELRGPQHPRDRQRLVGGTLPIAFVGCVDCLAANNTIVDPKHWILRILQETRHRRPHTFLPAQGGSFVNNLVYFSRASLSTYVNVGASTEAATFMFRNNLWYAHDTPAQSMPSLPAAETAGLYGQDPRLVAPASSDYALMAGSPPPPPARGWRMSLATPAAAVTWIPQHRRVRTLSGVGAAQPARQLPAACV